MKRYTRTTQSAPGALRPRRSTPQRLADVVTRLRADIAVVRARNQASDTAELWLELAREFPVQAGVIDPWSRWPPSWVWRGRDGRVQGIVIGGV